MKKLKPGKTCGRTTFAQCGDGTHHLLRVNTNVPAVMALEHASNLQTCANRLLPNVAMGDGQALDLWPALYLCEMAQAIVDDVAISC